MNEMNRKLYEENQQVKERNVEQRQQLDNFHMLFQENKKENERSMGSMRKELDEVYQREADLKRRIQQTLESNKQESYQIASQLKEKLDEAKANEAGLVNDLNRAKQMLNDEHQR